MIDLTQYVRGINGEPEMDTQQAALTSFDEAVEVTYSQGGRRKTSKFNAGITSAKKATFRNMLSRAVREAPEKKDVPDIDRRTELLIKLLADKVKLNSEDRGDIIKCVRAKGDPLYLARTQELFDQATGPTKPVENGQAKPAKKKHKK